MPRRQIATIITMRHSYSGFLISLLVLLFVQPFVGEQGDKWLSAPQVLVSIVMTLILVAGMLAACTRRRERVIGISLAALTLVAVWVIPLLRSDPGISWPHSTLGLLLSSCPALFYFYIARLTLGFVLRGQQVTQERIAAALCVYLLVGFGFSLLYLLIYDIRLGQEGTAFALSGSLGSRAPHWGDFIYFSFVTMTTVGYGDMTPTDEWARSLAVFQAILAVFYLAVLIARLIGSYKGEDEVKNPGP